MTHRKQQKS